MSLRNRLLRIALALVVGAAALLTAGTPVPEANAASVGCSVQCPDGSFCETNPTIRERCTCACDLFASIQIKCECVQLRPNIQG
jgi:hypothetical protein